jgi:hypothetical protein
MICTVPFLVADQIQRSSTIDALMVAGPADEMEALTLQDVLPAVCR